MCIRNKNPSIVINDNNITGVVLLLFVLLQDTIVLNRDYRLGPTSDRFSNKHIIGYSKSIICFTWLHYNSLYFVSHRFFATEDCVCVFLLMKQSIFSKKCFIVYNFFFHLTNYLEYKRFLNFKRKVFFQ